MRYQKLQWNVDLAPHKNALLNRSGDARYNAIEVDLLCSIVPELGELNSLLKTKSWSMFKPKTMTLPPRAWGGIHVDSSAGTHVIDCGFNIPIDNGPGMTTRWYDLSDINGPFETINWTANRLQGNYHQTAEESTWFRNNANWLVAERCIDTMLLDGTYLFYSGEPHNVDGRHSNKPRSMLSIRWMNLETNMLMTWADRAVFEELQLT
jgi:hypothetical protein